MIFNSLVPFKLGFVSNNFWTKIPKVAILILKREIVTGTDFQTSNFSDLFFVAIDSNLGVHVLRS